jgi:hypothetical protein
LTGQAGSTEHPADLDDVIAANRAAAANAPPDQPNLVPRLHELAVALRTRYQREGRSADLDDAITVARRAVYRMPTDHPDRAIYLIDLAGLLWTRFQLGDQLTDLDDSVTANRHAAEALSADHPNRVLVLSNLKLGLWTRYLRIGQPADVDAAVDAARMALDAAPADHPARAASANDLGVALRARFQRTGQLVDLDAAVDAYDQAVTATRSDHPDRVAWLSRLGLVLRDRFERTGRQTDLDAAVAAFRDTVAAAPANHPDRTHYLINLGSHLWARYHLSGKLPDLDAAIDAAREAAAATIHPVYLSGLGAMLMERFVQTDELADLDAAVAAFGEAVATAPADQPDRPRRLNILRTLLLARFERTCQLADLDAAVAAAREAADGTPDDHPHRPTYLSALGGLLSARYDRTGQLADLHAAIAVARDAATRTSADHPDRAGRLNVLGTVLQTRFRRTGQLADLDAAVVALREVAATVPAHDPSRKLYLIKLGSQMLDRFGLTGQLADLDDAVATIREIVTAPSPADHPDPYLSGLGRMLLSLMLLRRFGRTGQLADLDDAVTAAREAVDGTPGDHADRAERLTTLGIALRARFERTGQLADLDDAVTAAREAVDGTPGDHADRAGQTNNLALALFARFERTGRSVDLDDALTAVQAAVDLTSTDHPDRARWLINLAVLLMARFERTAQLADLNAAVTAAQQCVDNTPTGHPDRARLLDVLANAMRLRFWRTGQLVDLDAAATAAHAAVDGTPADHRDRAERLNTLWNTLRAKFEMTGQLPDLDAAFSALTEAADGSPHDHPGRPIILESLGLVLRARFEKTGQLRDLDAAVVVSRDAVEGNSAAHSRHAERLTNLGMVLVIRSGKTGSDDLVEAVECFRDAAREVTASPATRFGAALRWGYYAFKDLGNAEVGVEGYAAAVELLPLMTWHGLDRATREHHLRQWPGVAGEAAACAVWAGQPRRAVELLEAGRSLIWAQALQLRGDFSSLAKHAPRLAAEMDAVRAELQVPMPGITVTGDTVGGLPLTTATAVPAGLDRRRHAARRWDELLILARRLVGFEDFLRPATYRQLRTAAAGGPVVLLNVSGPRCQALVIGGPDTIGPQLVDLPSLTYSNAIERAQQMRGLATRATDRRRDRLPQRDLDPIGQEIRDRAALFDVLEWLWDTVADPVLLALDYTSRPADDQRWPRVWWCPTGPSALLPIHAAGYYRRGRDKGPSRLDTVPARVVSSYTPTLTALTRARQRDHGQFPIRQLVVGMPDTPGHSPLPVVTPELVAVTRHFRRPGGGRQLIGPAATRDAVRAAIPDHQWLHLACHGTQHATDPSRSGFTLADGLLTVAELDDLHNADADLAFLSACETATGSEQLPDEAIHLAGALQMIGYRHVIATQWTIDDASAPAGRGRRLHPAHRPRVPGQHQYRGGPASRHHRTAGRVPRRPIDLGPLHPPRTVIKVVTNSAADRYDALSAKNSGDMKCPRTPRSWPPCGRRLGEHMPAGRAPWERGCWSGPSGPDNKRIWMPPCPRSEWQWTELLRTSPLGADG